MTLRSLARMLHVLDASARLSLEPNAAPADMVVSLVQRRRLSATPPPAYRRNELNLKGIQGVA